VAVYSLQCGGVGDTVIIWGYADDFSCGREMISEYALREMNSLDILTTFLVEFYVLIVEVTAFHLP
jgi:hypothetical protein